MLYMLLVCCFFFQAEDGIRDTSVTGVQTCALPISRREAADPDEEGDRGVHRESAAPCPRPRGDFPRRRGLRHLRSEERRVGKECRCRWWAYHWKKKGKQRRVYE